MTLSILPVCLTFSWVGFNCQLYQVSVLTLGSADWVCISTHRRMLKAKQCSCGDYHSFAVMGDGDIYAWYAMDAFRFLLLTVPLSHYIRL